MIFEHDTTGCFAIEIRRPHTDTEVFTVHRVMDPHAAIALLCAGVFAELQPEMIAEEPRFAGQGLAGSIRVFADAEGYLTSDDDEDTPRRAIFDYATRTVELTSTEPDSSAKPCFFEDFIPACQDVLELFFADEGPRVGIQVFHIDL